MMRKIFRAVLLFVFIVFGITVGYAAEPDTIMQFSTIDAVIAGAYDGQMSLKELVKYGDLGIGTFDRLDGELILLDGRVYQLKADGRIYHPPMSLTTPFAAVVEFNPETTKPLDNGTDYPGLEKTVNKAAPNMNIFCGVKVKGRFSRMKTRSVPAQKKPYPPLTEVTKNQPVFYLENVSGTMVGFRSPVYVKGVGVPGYHLHFISEDFKTGGHVLGFVLEEGTVEIDVCNRFLLVLPGGDFGQLDLSLDRSEDLYKVQK